MEIFWVSELPSSTVSLVIPGAPTLYDKIYGKEREDKERILQCLMNIKREIDIRSEPVDVQNLKPVELVSAFGSADPNKLVSCCSIDESRTQTAAKDDRNDSLLTKLRNIARGDK